MLNTHVWIVSYEHARESIVTAVFASEESAANFAFGVDRWYHRFDDGSLASHGNAARQMRVDRFEVNP